jgi:hypothetical protein
MPQNPLGFGVRQAKKSPWQPGGLLVGISPVIDLPSHSFHNHVTLSVVNYESIPYSL